MSADVRARFAAWSRGGTARGALPAEFYRDPAFFELEIEHVLRPGWHAVARWDALPEPGDYASLTLFGEPLLAVRDDERRLRVFSRICRHRAHPVVEGAGNAKRFVCPYHRWSYGRDGSLLAAPLSESLPDFDRTSCGLPELRTWAWQGFVLVSLDPEADPPTGGLAALDARLDALGLAGMVTIGSLDFDSPWNWKVMVENFMESYHHLGPHAESLQKTNYAKDTWCDDRAEGPFALLENPGHDGAPDFAVAQVFPTLLLAAFEGMPVGTWYEMQIDRPDHFHLRIHMLTTPELAGNAEAVDGIREAVHEVHHEDIPMCEGVQRGIASRAWQPGPLTPYEGCLARFHDHLAQKLAG